MLTQLTQLTQDFENWNSKKQKMQGQWLCIGVNTRRFKCTKLCFPEIIKQETKDFPPFVQILMIAAKASENIE